MDKSLYDKIKDKLRKTCTDYDEMCNDYYTLISIFKSDKILDEILKFEKIQKELNLFQCEYALKKGYNLNKQNINLERINEYDELFDNGFEETIDIKALYALEGYKNISSKHSIIYKNICKLFENKETQAKFDDVYFGFSHDLMIAAYVLGCEIKQYNRLIENIKI